MEKDYLLKKWLLNGLTEEEQRTFDALEDAPLYKAIAASASHFKASHVSSPEAFETLKEKLPKQETAIKKVSWKKTLLQIASVLVIGLAVYYGFFNTQATHIKTVAAQKTTISLPDNSTVLLNTASTITYHEDSWEKERELQLDGEAFFKVAKGKKFDVKTSQGIVSVLGTQFNVKQRGTLFEVSCYEGIVQVSYAKTVKKLLAGDTFRIDAGIEYSGTTNHEAPQWTNNRSSFKSVKFQYVLEELERQYNIKVVYEGDKQTRFFTGAFVQDNLENALQSVTAPLGLTYTFEGTNKVIILD
ncbi:FecR family protein [Marinirhabdus gelatinilytica]|uniref:FecR family protein n=1 Tax=Marinirhabdus gelatinilytica TaxID=1703343 RepID=A0A370QIY1_9FLAO|nr:FecR family protein [Marinirhabdus gelatinilytica]RDK88323.1 FecR family protein [Marinirhabdus gelatinilytica]